MKEELKIKTHRGACQIGGTCIELSYGKSRILLDLGLPLYDKNFKDLPDGILDGRDPRRPADIAALKEQDILPDVKGLYQDEAPGFDAILISHSHGDHYGLVHFANPAIPLVMSEGARRMIETLNSFLPKKVPLGNVIPAVSGAHLQIGAFEVIPYFMDHSAFDARGFFVKVKETGETLFYSGDFRSGGSKGAAFERLVQNPPIKNVDHLVMEGTNIGRPEAEYKTEAEAQAALGEVLAKEWPLVLLACSGQNIDRIKAAYLEARKHGYEVVIDPYVGCVLDNIKGLYNSFVPQLDMPGVRALLCNFVRTPAPGYTYVNKIAEDPEKRFIHLLPALGSKKISPAAFADGAKRLVIVRDGIVPTLKKIPGIENAFVVYSQWKGYLKKNGRLTKFLNAKGLAGGVVFKYIHTSGHADTDTLKRLVLGLKPRKITPVHTEKPGLFPELFGNGAA